MADLAQYQAFLEAKVAAAREHGIEVVVDEVNALCKPHQRDIIRWAVRGGRRGIFAAFGLGKSIMQLEVLRITRALRGGAALIVAPLGVRQEFLRDARMLGINLRFVRTTAEMESPGMYITNYESVREGKVDTTGLTAVSLDEAAVLRGFGGTKTFREFMRRFESTPYKFVATATPAPNEYIEILSYAAFLGIMDVGEAKTRWFKRDSERADNLTLHPHKEAEFWSWCHTWAVFLQRPSELGYSDEGYELPPIDVRWHMVGSPNTGAGQEYDGQQRMFRDAAIGVQQAAAAKRATLEARVSKVTELLAERPLDHCILWHDLEDERRALEQSTDAVSVYGSQDLDERETAVMDFADGRIPRLAAKPVMLGSGCNLQRHCHWSVFVGVGFKFNDFVQAIHRIHRFLQEHPVTIDIIYSDAEVAVVAKLKEKWARHDELMARMSEIIRRYGLSTLHVQEQMERSIGVERREWGLAANWRAIRNDCVLEVSRMESASVGLIVTSIPFGTQYEYSPSYNDFGHSDDDEHFFQQMDFLSPELLRVIKPGRMMCVHVKDRIRPGGLDGLGFQSVSPFHANCILHYRRHGWIYMGMITVVTDVVRENNQTYRLGWSEQCKDGSRMGVGLPEYVLLFRRPPTDRSDGYADERVIKSKAEYSRARWQFDAHGFWRSSGDRLVTHDEMASLPADEVFKRFREWSSTRPYDHEATIALGEALEAAKRLPPGFMLLQPPSHHRDVWTDVARMRTLNGVQQAKGREMHLCPLQFDIVDRLINRFSSEGEVVMDPFAGLFTVPLRAVQLGRIGVGVELSAPYVADGVWHLQAAEEKRSAPTLFDLLPEEDAA